MLPAAAVADQTLGRAGFVPYVGLVQRALALARGDRVRFVVGGIGDLAAHTAGTALLLRGEPPVGAADHIVAVDLDPGLPIGAFVCGLDDAFAAIRRALETGGYRTVLFDAASLVLPPGTRCDALAGRVDRLLGDLAAPAIAADLMSGWWADTWVDPPLRRRAIRALSCGLRPPAAVPADLVAAPDVAGDVARATADNGCLTEGFVDLVLRAVIDRAAGSGVAVVTQAAARTAIERGSWGACAAALGLMERGRHGNEAARRDLVRGHTGVVLWPVFGGPAAAGHWVLVRFPRGLGGPAEAHNCLCYDSDVRRVVRGVRIALGVATAVGPGAWFKTVPLGTGAAPFERHQTNGNACGELLLMQVWYYVTGELQPWGAPELLRAALLAVVAAADQDAQRAALTDVPCSGSL